ncbi:phosphatidate cytidylyltransferase [Futiania mangrovi]|uniref:Phosphatidate cytidylyltransferase n=1 Tax=Futiania mangrovi TaxID=2959716 RepID=A0A9J6PA04_9PROT|nr:phosphatidate cytidylyltransferase [Futiania mangrovii]MCP1335821.1 phosphatidate cytidylyltransferase [Futiania mangrovii]
MSQPGTGAGSTRAFWTRVASALVLAPIALAAVWAGGAVYAALIFAAALLMMYEAADMARLDRSDMGLSVGGVGAGVLFAILAGPGQALVIGLAVTLALAVRTRGRPQMLSALAPIYTVASAVALLYLRQHPDGLMLIVWLLVTVWAADTGGYAAGKTIGGPKLAPRISPGKTWAGLAGTMVFAGLASAGFGLAAGRGSIVAMMAVGVVAAFVAQAGDLAESAYKRFYGRKDSGSLIPGHGGILDRVDGLVAAAILVHVSMAATGETVFEWP